MQSGGPITMYHLSRRDGTALFLHPFVKRGTIIDLTQSVELSGRYGREPRVESVTMLRNDLYRRIEEDVRDWINERRFIPRFLLAAGAFLMVFVFFAAVIRDPLPIVDETLLALGAGVIVFLAVGRRFEQSKAAAQRRVALRSKVDAVVFSEDPFVHQLEDLLQYLEEHAVNSSVPSFTDPSSAARDLWSSFPTETARAVDYLRRQLTAGPYRQLEKQLKKGRLAGKTLAQVEHGELSPGVVHLFYDLRDGARTS